MRKIATAALAALALGGCSTHTTPEPVAAVPAASTRSAPSVSTIRYELDGEPGMLADITIATATGTSQQQSIKVPMHSKSGATGLQFILRAGELAYISAQNRDSYGTLTCRIVDVATGSVLSENRASGGYAIATCKARTPVTPSAM
jgi:PBP1b-binding outer membrane lipoprotein LpoB